MVLAWFEAAGGLPQHTLEVHCSEATKAMVAAKIGYAFMSIHGVQRELAAGHLVRLDVCGLKLEQPIYMARSRRREPSRPLEAFLEVLATSNPTSKRQTTPPGRCLD